MPKEDERRKELTQKEIEAEKFRTFFSTSVAQVPEAMSRREEEETPPKRGLFGGLFQRGKPEPETKEPAVPTRKAGTGNKGTGGARVGAAAHGGNCFG